MTSARIHRVQALEQLGAEVFGRQADVADTGQMQQVVQTAVQRFGRFMASFMRRAFLTLAHFMAFK